MFWQLLPNVVQNVQIRLIGTGFKFASAELNIRYGNPLTMFLPDEEA